MTDVPLLLRLLLLLYYYYYYLPVFLAVVLLWIGVLLSL